MIRSWDLKLLGANVIQPYRVCKATKLPVLNKLCVQTAVPSVLYL